MVLVSSYGGLASSNASNIHAPKSTESILHCFRTVTDERASLTDVSQNVVIAAGLRSFGGQALPPLSDACNNTIMDITQLHATETIHMCPAADADRVMNSRRFVAYASWTFEKFLKHANAALAASGDPDAKDMMCMPFSTPTSHLITLGGAIASNGHSRTTQTTGGFMLDQLRWFRLAAPNGKIYNCSPQSPDPIETSLYFAVANSYGALGVILDLEIVVRLVSKKKSVIHVEVVEKCEAGGFQDLCRRFEALSKYTSKAAPHKLRAGQFMKNESFTEKHEAEDGLKYWDHGLVMLFFGNPKTAQGAVIGHNLALDGDGSVFDKKPSIALCDPNDRFNSYIQGIANRFPAWAMWIQNTCFKQAAQFKVDYYCWTYFQNAHDVAHRHLKTWSPISLGLRALVGVHPDLPVVHQAWLVPSSPDPSEGATYLIRFMTLLGDLFEDEVFAGVSEQCEFLDFIYLPPTNTNLIFLPSDLKGEPVKTDGYFVVTASIAAHTPLIRDRAIRMFQTVSAKSAEFGCRVHLLKQYWAGDDKLLRHMHAGYLSKLTVLKKIVDPYHILQSQLMNALLVPGNEKSL